LANARDVSEMSLVLRLDFIQHANRNFRTLDDIERVAAPPDIFGMSSLAQPT
jgi:hypothetical protein